MVAGREAQTREAGPTVGSSEQPDGTLFLPHFWGRKRVPARPKYHNKLVLTCFLDFLQDFDEENQFGIGANIPTVALWAITQVARHKKYGGCTFF